MFCLAQHGERSPAALWLQLGLNPGSQGEFRLLGEKVFARWLQNVGHQGFGKSKAGLGVNDEKEIPQCVNRSILGAIILCFLGLLFLSVCVCVCVNGTA